MSYSENPQNYPDWIQGSIQRLLEESVPSVEMEFTTPREAASQRERIYAYLRVSGLDKQFTVRKADVTLIIGKRASAAPKIKDGVAAVEGTEEEQQLIKQYDLKVKIIKIGEVSYWTITNGKSIEEYKYKLTLMDAIQAYLLESQGERAVDEMVAANKWNPEEVRRNQEASDRMLTDMGFGTKKE